jgi:hypothetical protein
VVAPAARIANALTVSNFFCSNAAGGRSHLILRLDFDQRVVVPDPERRRCGIVVDKDAAAVGLVRQRFKP